MKKLGLTFGLAAMFAMSAFAADTYKGFINDANCAKTKMNDPECAKRCVQRGTPPVLMSGDKIYKFANPDKVKEHVGQNVTVTGKLEGDTLTVESIAETK